MVGAILQGRHTLALACFGAAAVTDGIDGALARRFGWTTTVGAYLDPVADKALLSGVYLALAPAGTLPWWFVGLVFGRDILILLGPRWLFFSPSMRKFPPSVWGKLSTFLQIVTAVAWMAHNVAPVTVVRRRGGVSDLAYGGGHRLERTRLRLAGRRGCGARIDAESARE